MKIYNKLIEGIPMPARVRRLDIDPERGFPVPWFVAWMKDSTRVDAPDGSPDFRCVDTPKIGLAINKKLCWVCGEKLGTHLAFAIGPMCAVTRVTSEPPAHLECAQYAVQACPFLNNPRMRRNEKDLPEERTEAAGFSIPRNPGVIAIWVTKSYRYFRPSAGAPGILFRIGEPLALHWWTERRRATMDEILASINSGLPALRDIAVKQGGASMLKELEQQVSEASLVFARFAPWGGGHVQLG